jgi:hypothetical protein
MDDMSHAVDRLDFVITSYFVLESTFDVIIEVIDNAVIHACIITEKCETLPRSTLAPGEIRPIP